MLYFNGKPYFVPFIESSSTGGIIEVDSLPTDNIKENAFYLVGGKYYRWEKNGIVGTWVKYVPTLVDNDIRGTWVFNDVLDIPNDFYGNEYHFKYSVYDIPNIGDMEYTSLRFYDDGIKYIEYVTADGGDDAVYQEGVGWFSDMQAYKTIVITESPTDETFIAWLKENATKKASGEESVVGTWVFKDDPSPNGYEDVVYNKTYHFDYYTIEYDGNDVPIGVCEFDEMNFEFDGSYFRISYYGNDFSALPAYDSSTQTGWSHDSLKTITITKSPTDERFISWLKENATKQASEPTGVSVAVVNKLPTKNIRQNTLYRMNDNYYKRNETNVLVFNDALSVPEKMYSKTYLLSFSINVPNGPVLTFTEITFGSMGEVSFYTNGVGIDSAYSGGWKDEKYKTININEMPTDEVLLEWLRSNAMAEGSWDEYAETTSITPIKSETWVFNDELTNIDKPFTNGFEDVACSGYMLYDYGNEPFNFHFSTIRFCFDSKHSILESIRLINSDTDGISIYYIDTFVYSFRHRTITFTELPDDEVFLAWLKANATKTSGGSSDTGAITEIQTPEELDEILANATSSDVGKAYAFVGESNGKYKNGSIYIIREV